MYVVVAALPSLLSHFVVRQPSQAQLSFSHSAINILARNFNHSTPPASPLGYPTKADTAITHTFPAYHFIPPKHRVVITVDVSPSMASVNAETGHVILDEVRNALRACLHALLQPTAVPGLSHDDLGPIYLTVLVQSHPQLQPLQPIRALVDGYHLRLDQLDELMLTLEHGLVEAEGIIRLACEHECS
jgi:hypothetical protein